MESEKTITIYDALLEVQKKEIYPKKKAKGVHSNMYATLRETWEACRDTLCKNNIVVNQIVIGEVLETVLYHTVSGEKIVSHLPLTNTKGDMQGLGSAITYARRYALITLIGAIPEDDDGAAASNLGSTSTASPAVVTANPGQPSDKQKNYLHGLLKSANLTGEKAITFAKETIGKNAPVTVADYSKMINELKDGGDKKIDDHEELDF